MALPNQQAVNYQNYNISVMGDVGTAGAEYSMDFNTNLGGIRFMCSDKDTKLLLHARRALNWREINIWETKIRCALEGSHGSIIMFDENSPTYSEVPELIRKIRRFCGNIPIVLCRNRVDLRHIVNASQLMQLPGNIKYCEISAPSNYNIERPFLLLAMMLVSPSISFMEEMAHLVPPQALPNQQAVDYPSFKVVILGAASSGKTTFVERHVDGDNNKFDDPGTGVTVHPMDFRANIGRIRFNCWVTTGLSRGRFLNCREIDIWSREISLALKDAHGAIIMFDVTERPTYDHVNTLFLAIERVCPGIPVVLCGNKVDLQNRNVNAKLLAGWLDGNTRYCEISARSNYNFEKPFLLLARELVRRDGSIWFREPPAALVPAEFEIDFEVLRRNEEFLGAVSRARRRAICKRDLMPLAKRFLNRRRNLDPNSPLPDHDDELMWMVEMHMMK